MLIDFRINPSLRNTLENLRKLDDKREFTKGLGFNVDL